jgi:hypothetical protein
MDGAKGSKPTEKDVVEKWLKDVPEIGTAYWLKEQLSDILQLTDRPKAEERLDAWLEEIWGFVKHFRAKYEKHYRGEWDEPVGNVVHTVNLWRSMILNYIDCKHSFERKVTNAFAEYANREIGKAHLLGSSYTYEVLRVKVIYGGLLVSRRPPHPLKEMSPATEKGHASRRGGKKKGGINPQSNGARLERGREARDETKNLLPDPHDNAAWASRFEQRDQPDLSFDQGVWEPSKKKGRGRKEKDKQQGPGKRARPPRNRSGGQIKLF